MAKVIAEFTDLKDNRRHYIVGDNFPSDEASYEVTQERLNELASSDNRQGKPLIELDEVVRAPKEFYDIEGYTLPELKKMAKERGLEGYSKLNKQKLIELLNK